MVLIYNIYPSPAGIIQYCCKAVNTKLSPFWHFFGSTFRLSFLNVHFHFKISPVNNNNARGTNEKGISGVVFALSKLHDVTHLAMKASIQIKLHAENK